ncbi:sulfatase-like hydrolase/transferase [Pedobacter sp. SD-b]|uniref:Sulfatase-like hydrolase/transferase n=1 Tax=Pedobacter segetis TaxID=2793069 RepID=A0ABS1BP73_9SPHI|nr:sulfatase-like hydrolase/transferase [Pedobacter segetis]MBK0384054.1 sulfatase-like hydrolase/transferase [Pedobacter segetis]
MFKTAPLILLLASTVIANAQTTKTSKATQKPNIIFILTDDLGYGDLGVFYQNQLALDLKSGIPRQFTPNLDKMAGQGALLSQSYAAAPVCAPSRASIISGRSQGEVNVRDNQFDKALENNLNMAVALKKSGYTTAAIGKWGLQGIADDEPNWSAHPLNRGFDYYMGYIRHSDGHEHYPKEGLYRGKKRVYENRIDITAGLDKCYTTDLWTAAAKRWIVKHERGEDKNKPFFMYLAYDTPHAVLELPTQPYPSGKGLNGGMQWTGKPGQMISTASGKIDSWIYPDYAKATYDDDGNKETPEKPWPNVYKRYATDVHRIDEAVGDVLALLKDLKIDDNTMVVFTSDNGPSIESYLPKQDIQPTFFKSFGPFDGIKRDCWEGGLRMPTIARWPGQIPAGNNITTPSISYDWMPTFIDMAGSPIPAITDGVSLVPSLTKKGDQRPSNIYIEYFQKDKTPNFKDFLPAHRSRVRNQMQVLRLGNFVGVRYDIKEQSDDFEIYDVVNDPQEGNNLAKNPEMAALQQKFKDLALQSRMPNSTANRPYDDEMVPSLAVVAKEKGLLWKAYNGDFPWVPEMLGVKPDASGVTAVPDVSVMENKQAGSLYFDGYIKIPAEGRYTFYVSANTGAILKINNAVVVDADFAYFPNSVKSGSINLGAGLHRVRLYTTSNGSGKHEISLEWSKPGMAKETIPASVFYH